MNEKKSWKLFGKLNIIDLLIIVIVVAALVILGGRLLKNRSVGSTGQHVRVSFYGFEDVHDYVPASFTLGDPVTQYQTELNLGTLTAFDSEPAYELAVDPQTGETLRLPLLGESFVTFTSECYGRLDRTGLTIGDTTFVVGGNYFVNVGPTRAGYQITAFELID